MKTNRDPIQSSKQAAKGKQTLRIIGGQWRGRKLRFPEVAGLRPTPDRVRETLFNWLQMDIRDARCLDLCCGSGALGLEALSRGANRVTFIDRDKQVIRQLKENCIMLKTSQVDIVQADALKWLKTMSGEMVQPFNIVFVDPPFRQGLIGHICHYLLEKGLVCGGSKLYIERESELEHLDLAGNYQLSKTKTAGQVNYSLYDVTKE